METGCHSQQSRAGTTALYTNHLVLRLTLMPPPPPIRPAPPWFGSHCPHPPNCQVQSLELSHPASNPPTVLAWSTFKRCFQAHRLLLSPMQTSIHLDLDQCEQPPPVSWLRPHASAVCSPPAARARLFPLGRSLPWLFKSPQSSPRLGGPAGPVACLLPPRFLLF